ncbi:MAG: hypothetical protein AAF063_15680 [Cyanobacteria bacterium J06643_5]
MTAIAGLEISKLLKDSKDSSIQTSISEIRKISYGYSEKINISQDLSSHRNKKNIQYQAIQHKGTIPSKRSKSNLINAAKKILCYASESYGKIVLLFDGLDRLNDYKIFSEIIDIDIDVEYLSNLNIGFVIVGPLSSIYKYSDNPIENALDYFYRQPCFDVENDSEAYNFFVQILKARSQDDFLEETAIDLLVKFSGGILRDLINLTQAAIEETYISGEEKLSKNYVLNAVESLGKSQILGLSNDELEILQIIMKKGKFIPRTEQDIKLLVTRRIIEYVYPKQRYVVHPAIVPIIEQIHA